MAPLLDDTVRRLSPSSTPKILTVSCLFNFTYSHRGSTTVTSPPESAVLRKLTPVSQQPEDLDFGENVDMATFEQILDMDEEPGEREFSQGIVFDFFNQAEGTFADMDTDM
jgi:hypothetical protein